MGIVSDKCREVRQTLLIYKDRWASHPVNLNGCFDHALNCDNCYRWAVRHELQDLLKKYAEDKTKDMHCPFCHQPMKVNLDFKIAKCVPCNFELCWMDSVRMLLSLERMCQMIAKKKGIDLAGTVFEGIP